MRKKKKKKKKKEKKKKKKMYDVSLNLNSSSKKAVVAGSNGFLLFTLFRTFFLGEVEDE
jgi:hypothetical protein